LEAHAFRRGRRSHLKRSLETEYERLLEDVYQAKPEEASNLKRKVDLTYVNMRIKEWMNRRDELREQLTRLDKYFKVLSTNLKNSRQAGDEGRTQQWKKKRNATQKVLLGVRALYHGTEMQVHDWEGAKKLMLLTSIDKSEVRITTKTMSDMIFTYFMKELIMPEHSQ
jgi:hypothetical protein